MSGLPKWQMHRGHWTGGLRENTLQAFRSAKDMGANMVEFDVRVSRDGVPVCFHDSSLSRIFHVKKKVSRTSWEDLSGLNITRLEDVINDSQVPQYLNVELKSENPLPLLYIYRVYRVLSSVRKKRYLLSSFNPMCLFFLTLFWPGVSRALLIPDSAFVKSWKFKVYFWLSQPRYLHVHHEILDDREARELLLARQLPISVWTVNDIVRAAFLLERGAASVISDNPPPPYLKNS